MIRNVQVVDDDIVEMKRLIKQKLIDDPDILEALHNTDLGPDNADEYLGTNIFGFIRIPTTQDTVRNFICFTVDDISAHEYNSHMKVQQIKFNCICHLDDIRTNLGIDRHDLLSFLVRENFNWTNDFGMQFHLVQNKESAMEGDYYCRTLIFERTCTNSLKKAVRSNPNDRS